MNAAAEKEKIENRQEQIENAKDQKQKEFRTRIQTDEKKRTVAVK